MPTVLIVEDEYLIADDLARALNGAGMNVIGPVATVADARAAAEEQPVDCALLDMNLGGELAYELARWFSDRGTHVTIVTGYDAGALPKSLDGIPVVQKPFTASSLIETLAQACYRTD